MNRFAQLLDRLSYEPGRNNKLRLMTDYFRSVPDPERGFALAALTGALSFQHAKPNLIRALIATRVDPYLFGLSYDYVGDLSETVALLWPTPPRSPSPLAGEGARRADEGASSEEAHALGRDPSGDDPSSGASRHLLPQGEKGGCGEESALHLSDVVATLATAGKLDLPRVIAGWLDALDETGRWALLKLITGSLRIGVSARLAKTAVAALGAKAANEIEEVWHGLAPPYLDLFAWVEGRADKPDAIDPAPFHTAMLAHPLETRDMEVEDPTLFTAEWKWDGIRVQATRGLDADDRIATRLYSRTGEDISETFPDLTQMLADLPHERFSLDGELLVVRDHLVQPFGVLQQRLNRRTVSLKLLADYPAAIRAYDILTLDGEDLRPLPFRARRETLAAFVGEAAHERLDLSPIVAFQTWDDLARARKDPAGAGAGPDAEAIEGLMLKRADSPYLPGRPKGLWYKWKRDPFTVDAVMMYAQRGHGKRSSFYSDYTFGVWRTDEEGEALVPVGKAYFGFTDEELAQLDRFVRNNTTNRFGPVREVVHGKNAGLVLEIAFEGLNRSTRHKSGVAMRFPRVARIRWDKPAREADRIETLEALLRVPV